MPTHNEVLSCPINPDTFGHPTVGGVLGAMLAALIHEGEMFSGKRPLGNSGWNWDLYAALVKAGLVEGSVDDDGYLNECDTQSADRLLADAAAYALQHPKDPQEERQRVLDSWTLNPESMGR